MLILIFGLPGTGKTTFARALAKSLDAWHLNSDIIRDALGKKGTYDASAKKSIYTEMLLRAEAFLREGKIVVVDATFYKKEFRDPFIRMAKSIGVKFVWIEVSASEAIVEKRVGFKRPYSEADFTVYQEIKANFEPLEEEHLVLKTDELSLSEMVESAKGYLPTEGD